MLTDPALDMRRLLDQPEQTVALGTRSGDAVSRKCGHTLCRVNHFGRMECNACGKEFATFAELARSWKPVKCLGLIDGAGI